MKEIKFRAWRIHRSDCALYNEPAYPKEECDCGAKMLYNPWKEGLFVDFRDGLVQYDGCSDYSCEPSSSSLCWLPVNDKYYLMQYTGLKDKNGKEIYEGDILRYHGYHNLGLREEESVDKVEWGETGDSDGWAHECHFEWTVGGDSLADIYDEAEIIGNIYENPELLALEP